MAARVEASPGSYARLRVGAEPQDMQFYLKVQFYCILH
jgi:hypothetical protein